MNEQPGACTVSVTVLLELTWNSIDGSEWPQHSNRPDCCQIKVLHLQAIFKGSCQHDEKVQSVPRVGQVRVLAVDSHGDHLNCHFHAEEDENDVVKDLKDIA